MRRLAAGRDWDVSNLLNAGSGGGDNILRSMFGLYGNMWLQAAHKADRIPMCTGCSTFKLKPDTTSEHLRAFAAKYKDVDGFEEHARNNVEVALRKGGKIFSNLNEIKEDLAAIEGENRKTTNGPHPAAPRPITAAALSAARARVIKKGAKIAAQHQAFRR